MQIFDVDSFYLPINLGLTGYKHVKERECDVYKRRRALSMW